ncbi:hypothetical protein HDU76_001280 [Blyttiomyces sp. JEL0837]|nr:hypothetical protein HDU76_001280 [Blyttiomyces sp. JEL0837]
MSSSHQIPPLSFQGGDLDRTPTATATTTAVNNTGTTSSSSTVSSISAVSSSFNDINHQQQQHNSNHHHHHNKNNNNNNKGLINTIMHTDLKATGAQAAAPAKHDHDKQKLYLPMQAPIEEYERENKIKSGNLEDATDQLLRRTYPILEPTKLPVILNDPVQPIMETLDMSSELQQRQPIIIDNENFLADVAFSIKKLVQDYPVKWSDKKQHLIDKVIKPTYKDTDFIRASRCVSADLPFELQRPDNLKGFNRAGHNITDVELVKSFSQFANEHANAHGRDHFVMEYYVSFSDQTLFGFCDTDRFASDEIMVMQHPCLGSLRNALEALQKHVLLEKTYRDKVLGDNTLWMWKTFNRNTPLLVDDKAFYLPKDKKDKTFRMSEIRALTKDFSNLPTPWIITGVPLKCHIKTSYTEGKGDKAVSRSIYGKEFRATKVNVIEKHNLITIDHCAESTYNNYICMAAPDWLVNPLRPRRGPYTRYQIRQIFRTAYTAFRGAVLKAEAAREAWKRLRERTIKGFSNFNETCNVYPGVAIEGPHGKEYLKHDLDLDRVEVVVHTGDWGCGEFGGKDAKGKPLEQGMHVKMAKEFVNEIWHEDGKIKAEELFEKLEAKKYEWKKKKEDVVEEEKKKMEEEEKRKASEMKMEEDKRKAEIGTAGYEVKPEAVEGH